MLEMGMLCIAVGGYVFIEIEDQHHGAMEGTKTGNAR